MSIPSDTSHPDSIYVPTDRSIEVDQCLRRVVDDLPLRVWAVSLISGLERFTFWGMTAPWQNYMQNSMDDVVRPGALDLGQSRATNIYYAFYLFYYVTPLALAVVSDTKLGRYKTLCISAGLYLVGCLVLFVTSIPAALHRGSGIPGLVCGMVLIGLGGGGFKAVMPPFIGDQYTRMRPIIRTTKTGEQVITDRAMTLQYVYNVYYWFCNIGSLSWFASTYLEKLVGFWAAYLMTTCSLCISLVLLVVGGKYFVKIPPQGNILPKATKVLVVATRHRCQISSADPMHQMEAYGNTVPWSSHFVLEVKRGLVACRVLIAFIFFYICFNQMQNNLVSQAGQMTTHGVPNDFVPAMNQVSCIVIGPLIQNGLYPLLQSRGVKFGPIARITVGFGFVIAAMAYAAVVQHLVYTSKPCFDHPLHCPASDNGRIPNAINVWIGTPTFVLIAFAEIFAYVTGLEYAYAKAPKDMKTIVQSFSLLVAGVGAALGMAISPAAKDPKLVGLYAGLAGVMAVATGVFWWLFRGYDELDEEMDGLDLKGDVSAEGGVELAAEIRQGG